MRREGLNLQTETRILIELNDYLAISLSNVDLQGLQVLGLNGSDLGKHNFDAYQTIEFMQEEWVSPYLFVTV